MKHQPTEPSDLAVEMDGVTESASAAERSARALREAADGLATRIRAARTHKRHQRQARAAPAPDNSVHLSDPR